MRFLACIVIVAVSFSSAFNARAEDWSAQAPDVAAMLRDAEQLKAAGRNADAARLIMDAVAKQKAIDATQPEVFAKPLWHFVDLLIDEGHSDATEAVLLSAYANNRQSYPGGNPERLDMVAALKSIYRRAGRKIEFELLQESERRDKFNGEYAASIIAGLFRPGEEERKFEMTFGFAQLATSEASFALARMALRRASGSLEAGALLRRRQDLFEAWRKMEAAGESSRVRKRDIAAQVADIDAQLALLVPEKARIAAEKEVSIEEALGGAEGELETADVQSFLAPTDAFLLFAAPKWQGADNLFLWVITKTERKWIKVDLGTKSLEDWVAGLRCGLDHGSWVGKGRQKCASLLGLNPETPLGTQPPFDFSLAHELYKTLFGQVEDLIAGKHLFVVPAGVISRLPFHVLVTKPPPATGGKEVSWFVRDHAVTVLPSVFALKALRTTRGRGPARLPMIAFANPAIDGNEQGLSAGALSRLELRRRISRHYQTCDVPPSLEEQTLALFGEFGETTFLGAAETVAAIRKWAPIPDTAKLVCGIAADPAFAESRVLLADNATERKLRELNAEGELFRYRIVHFATHGAVVGNFQGASEAGLILTPPSEVTDTNDDGYLAASEIAELNLNADWAILSACNTAAGGEKGADQEALSGLARAFFYAGARAVLVSHWSVAERAAVDLVAGAVRHQSADGIGRSEALRRAMVDMLDKGDERSSHPAYWAPFVVVGEGAAPLSR